MRTLAVKKKKRGSIILRITLLVFAVYMIYSLSTLQIELAEKKKQLSEIQVTKAEKQMKVDELTSLLENGTEKDFIEKAAREKLNYVYRNEQIYKFD